MMTKKIIQERLNKIKDRISSISYDIKQEIAKEHLRGERAKKIASEKENNFNRKYLNLR